MRRKTQRGAKFLALKIGGGDLEPCLEAITCKEINSPGAFRSNAAPLTPCLKPSNTSIGISNRILRL